LQAGQSGRGMAFAVRWAEMVFTAYPNLEMGRKVYSQFKSALAEGGRDPSSVKVVPAVRIVVAPSESQAQDELAMIESLAKPIDSLTLLCEALNVDFSKRPYDEPFTDEALASVSWH